MAFILSAVPSDYIDEGRLQRLHALIAQALAEHGVIHISKEVGVFIAAGGKI